MKKFLILFSLLLSVDGVIVQKQTHSQQEASKSWQFCHVSCLTLPQTSLSIAAAPGQNHAASTPSLYASPT